MIMECKDMEVVIATNCTITCTCFTSSSTSQLWELFFQKLNHAQELFLPIAASMFVKFSLSL